MDKELAAIGARVRSSMPPKMTQRDLAGQLDMTADALSRALNGQRGFASIELAKIADVLDVDLHWLITGQEDPHRLRVAARHRFDHGSKQRDVPGFEGDEGVLAAVAHAYRQAYPRADHPSKLALSSAEDVRGALGDGFVREFADRLEAALNVDVVRVPGLSTDYSVTVGGRSVIVLAANSNWFRSNFSLAHELGHLALGHHDVDDSDGNDARERVANRFAADLLMPRSVLTGIDWTTITPSNLAQFIWNSGVSTDALLTRLNALRLPVGDAVRRLLEGTTQRLLRLHGGDLGERAVQRGPFTVWVDPIAERMNAASARRFPLSLQEAHSKRIGAGEITPVTLAWMLDTDVEDLVVDRAEPSEPSADELASILGL